MTPQCDSMQQPFLWTKHLILYTTFSMSIFPLSNLMRLFPLGLFQVQGLPWWGPDEDGLKVATRTVLSNPGDFLLSAVENVVNRMQCGVHEKGCQIERGLVLWCLVISSL
ncbi:hypothetical protein AVEN_255873-1 [Araneus ventricosus]|uniref:Uncharacterized protein n=1 Tax=Araneus ventricosus TaxID=182803 RepID=A0A4Y2DEZ1_ARAVE|nr:hypothetical protein AVEN_255873-1 [Araneus ventricosus]